MQNPTGDPQMNINTNKKVKINVLKKQAEFSVKQIGLFVAAFAVVGGAILFTSLAAPASKGSGGKPGGGGTTVGPLSQNVNQNWTNDPKQYITLDHCFGIDTQATWNGTGTLAPGETYTFNPSYPTCAPSEIPYINMHVDWTGSTDVKLQSKVAFINKSVNPIPNTSTLNGDELSKTIASRTMSAPNGHKQANFCEFTDAEATGSYLNLSKMTYQTLSTPVTDYVPINWSATITNTGTQTATVTLSGQEQNGWPSLYYPNCYRSDADGDYWNDSLEQTIFTRISNLNTNYDVLGSNYLNSMSIADPNYPAMSGSPADFNSDNKIDSTDVAMVQSYVGQGSGVPQDELDHDTLCEYNCSGKWSRFDLDGDGYVTQHDVSEVQALIGKPLPLDADYLAPWAVVETPSTVPANYNGYQVHAFASDNYMLTHVTIAAGGKTLCDTWGTAQNLGKSGQGLWWCAWTTPRSSGVQTPITVTAYDDSGHAYSATKVVTTQ